MTDTHVRLGRLDVRRRVTPQAGRFAAGAALALTLGSAAVVAQIPGRNVNMVSGTTLPDGDPYLQRQNEPSIAASTRNPLHLLGGANDYRTVDIPGIGTGDETGDAWLGVFKSTDGGQRWTSTLIPGYPQDQSAEGLASPLKGYQAGADPVVRAGTNGLLYYAGLAFDRGDTGRSAIFVARFIDNNNRENGDPVAYLGTRIVAANPGTRFLDKPWLAVDIPRGGAATCTIPAPGSRTQQIPAGAAYVTWTAITGTGANLRSQILLSRSVDCGVTWSAPVTLSRAQDPINQGTTIAIDPRTGAVIVAWRTFASPGASDTDSIVAARSNDFGRKFDPPYEAHRFPKHGKAAKLPPWVFEHRGKDKDRGDDDDDDAPAGSQKLKFNPAITIDALATFDQSTGGDRFRTNGYPAMTIDGSGRVYVAWAERGYSTVPGRNSAVDGDAKIVMSTSSTGTRWTAPRAVAEMGQPGHQFMPSVTFAGGKLMLVYYDLRDDISQSFSAFADDTSARPSGHRRTMDIRASLGTPGSAPVFAASVKVSDYAIGSRLGSRAVEQLQFNPPNLPMFKLGSVPFVGDYIDLAPAPAFVPDGRGGWTYNVQASTTLPAFQAVWTDNRDVRPPTQHKPDGSLDWTRYSPPRSAFNPGAVCDPDSVGSRNQNIYTSRIAGGLIVGSPGNNKPLNPTLQRGFVVFAQNTTTQVRTFRMTIAAQPTGGRASFSQFPAPPFTPASAPPLASIDVTTAPLSLVARTVYVTSSNPLAPVQVDVREIAAVGGAALPNGLQGTAYLNPDITNPDITNPDITNPDITNPDITNAEVHNPDITNPDITNPDITNPDITNPDITNTAVMNPDITNPDITNPDITNPDITNPDITNPDITNPDITNAAITDVSWSMQNTGNTTTAYNVNLFLANQQLPAGVNYQLVLHKVYKTPVAIGCDLSQQEKIVLLANIPSPLFVTPTSGTFVDQNDPRVTNATLWLAPGEVGRITLRLLDFDPRGYVTLPSGATAPAALIPALQTITPVVIAQPVGSPQVLLGQTKPPAVTPGDSTILFLQQPTTVNVGQPITPAVSVQVRDASGAVVRGIGVTLSLGANPGGAVLIGGGTALSNVDGIATFGPLSIDKLGVGYTLIVTVGAPGFTPATSAPFDVRGIIVSIPGRAGGTDNVNQSGPGGSVPVNTGVFVPAGQSVIVSAAGRYSFGADSGPEGLPGAAPGTFLAPGLTQFAVIARFGPGSAWQPVGAGPVTLTALTSGFLELAVNDDFYDDNSGALTAVVQPPAAASTHVVTNGADSGPGSLRAAIDAANAGVGPQGIAFNIAQPQSNPINLQTPLVVTQTVYIDGSTQPGYAGAPLIVVDGDNMTNRTAPGLRVTADGSTVRALVVSDFGGAGAAGIELSGAGGRLFGSYVGLTPDGAFAAGNDTGVNASGFEAVIGGPLPSQRNVISGNTAQGIWIRDLAVGHKIEHNLIGTNAAGGNSVANGVGVRVNGTFNTIGGSTPLQRNVVSGNGTGILFSNDAGNNVVQGNYIGTDASGAFAIANNQGIASHSSPANLLVSGNLISGNVRGISLQDGTNGAVIENNSIGVSAGGAALGNTDVGIETASLNSDASVLRTSVVGNTIKFNGGPGVRVTGYAFGTDVKANVIDANAGLGIDLNGDGITANDEGDTDFGPNNLQNTPVIDSAVTSGAQTTIAFGLDSAAGGYRFDFYITASCGQGSVWLGSMPGVNGAGQTFVTPQLPNGTLVTATATDNTGNTSEFSSCTAARPPAPPPPTAAITSASPSPIAAGVGQMITIRGTNLPGTSAADVVFSQGTFEAPAHFVWSAGSSRVMARLPVTGLAPGPAAVRISNAATGITTAPFPITISLTPGTPQLLKAMAYNCISGGGSQSALSGVSSGQSIGVAAEGFDTAGVEFLLSHSTDGVSVDRVDGPLASPCTLGDADGNVVASVTLPALDPGYLTIQVRVSVNGVASDWSNPTMQPVIPPPGPVTVVGPAGGFGGNAFAPVDCPAGSVVVGFLGRAGDDIDRTELACAATPALTPTGTFFVAGGTGGQDYGAALTCGGGEAVTGVYGGINGNGWIDYLGVTCTTLSTGASHNTGTAGLNQGGSPFTLSCPAGKIVTGVEGRQGALMDQISIRCQ
ncbi:MAG: hypothetical protein JWL71_2782 [Acidobacteria bacterium]|nr:hypothetical protein [Acidobacteriota bacterium]